MNHAPHPVTTQHLPAKPRERTAEHVARGVHAALDGSDGDILAFLPGVGEIMATSRILAGCGAEVVPLHGSLSAAQQAAALQPSQRRRVVLATNVAETSLTVPGVRAVVDSGLARVARFDQALVWIDLNWNASVRQVLTSGAVAPVDSGPVPAGDSGARLKTAA